MRITIEVRKDHLRVLPPVAALVAGGVTISIISGLVAVVTTLLVSVVAFVATAMVLAAADSVATRIRDRRRDRELDESIALHPANVPENPQRIKGVPA